MRATTLDRNLKTLSPKPSKNELLLFPVVNVVLNQRDLHQPVCWSWFLVLEPIILVPNCASGACNGFLNYHMHGAMKLSSRPQTSTSTLWVSLPKAGPLLYSFPHIRLEPLQNKAPDCWEPPIHVAKAADPWWLGHLTDAQDRHTGWGLSSTLRRADGCLLGFQPPALQKYFHACFPNFEAPPKLHKTNSYMSSPKWKPIYTYTYIMYIYIYLTWTSG